MTSKIGLHALGDDEFDRHVERRADDLLRGIPAVVKTDNYTVQLDDAFGVLILNSSDAKTFTLPPLATVISVGKLCFDFKNVGSGILILDGNGAETIEGEATFKVTAGEGGRLVALPGLGWYFSGSPPPRRWISAEYTLAASAEYTMVHNMKGRPRHVMMWLKNITSEFGYSPGEMIPIFSDGNGTDNRGVPQLRYINDNSCSFIVLANGLRVANRSSAGNLLITNSSWRFIIELVF